MPDEEDAVHQKLTSVAGGSDRDVGGNSSRAGGEFKRRPSPESPLLGQKCMARRMVSYDELPKWRQENNNPYIVNGYRVGCDSYKACFQSWLYLHNESMNIWSHGCGMFAFIVFWGITYGDTLRGNTNVHQHDYLDDLTFAPFLLGATLCLCLSTLYHTFEPCGKKVSLAWAKADYVGIVVLIWGSNFPVVHYLFYCSWVMQIMYLSIITGLSVAAIVVSVFDRFQNANLHQCRAILFSSLGLMGLAPVLHFAFTNNLTPDAWSKLYYLFSMGGFYLGGAAFYATRVPERFFSGSCVTDMIFSSHFIFHMAVIAGAVCHWMGSVYEFRHINKC